MCKLKSRLRCALHEHRIRFHLIHPLGFELDEKRERRAISFFGKIKRGGFSAGLFHVVDGFNWRCHAYCLMGNPIIS